MSEPHQDYLARIKKLYRGFIRKKKLSSTKFAQLAGLHHWTMVKFERGWGMTRYSTLQKIEDYIERNERDS